MLYVCPTLGLKIVIKPKKKGRDSVGNPVQTEGEYIKFEDGKYRTDDPDKITFLNKFIKANAEGIKMIDEKKVTRDKKIMDRVRKLAEKEIDDEDKKETERVMEDKEMPIQGVDFGV